MRLVWATVTEVLAERPGLQRLAVQLDDDTTGSATSYPALSGACVVGERVLLNCTAVTLGLGTGGEHFVVARVGSDAGIALDEPSGGHIMKLRYTPLQVDVVAVEAPESPHHETMRTATSLEGLPVVCCGLHSQVPLVAAAIKRHSPSARVVFCMTDQGALPLWLSSLARSSVEAGLLDATITCGQSVGGDFEAVTLHSGLLAARAVAGADVAIVAIGPGVVGTATPFGHGGVAQGEALNAAAAVGGTAIGVLRLSFADVRERHRGVSHHSLTALASIASAPVLVPVPTLADEQARAVDEALTTAGVFGRHERVESPEGALDAPDLRGVEVRTMGRGIDADPAFFSAAFAAGEVASRLVGA